MISKQISSIGGGLNWYNTMADGKSIEDDDDDGDGGIIGLHSLLSHTIEDWSVIYHYIQRQRNSEKARERYYKNESPLQLALRARERIKEVEGEIGRINVLRALVDSDPKSICSRDNEGRTPLHTACSSSRSGDVLQWLIKAEETLVMHERSITLRTDYPGGSLPLHLIAACASFDCTPTTTKPDDDHPLNIYPLQCTITNNIRKAYECTAIIRQAYPQAIWEVDCDGEIPLHASATYGNVGSLLALLVGCTDMESVKGASLMADDRGKTPLDRACERLCSMCVHGRKKESRTRNTSFRKSIARDDPFQAIGSTNTNSNEGDRRSLLLRSSQRGSGRTRIPGCGSSFRNSFSSSFLLGESVLGIDEQLLRDSFVSPRRPIDINLGLEELDRDGAEEIAKVDLLARAAHGFFVIGSSETYTYTDNFQLVHSVIALDCPPEIIWHACAIHKDQVGERDAFGRTPLFIACERFVTLYSQQHKSLKVSTEDDTTQDDDSSQAEAEATTSKFVASILLGCDTHLLENTSPFESSESLPSPVESETNNGSNNDLMNKISLSKEVISILLHSPLFGKTEMASVTDAAGRLPLHIILEGGVGWKDDGTEDSNSYNVVQSLIEVYPRALEVKDDTSGLLPFMIAALPKESSSASENQECTKQIETIFQLLCRDPNAVVLGVSRQRQDNYHWV